MLSVNWSLWLWNWYVNNHTNADSLSSSNSGGGHAGSGGGEVAGEDTDVSGSEGRCNSEAIESGISSLAMAGWAGTNHPICCFPSLDGLISGVCFFIEDALTSILTGAGFLWNEIWK